MLTQRQQSSHNSIPDASMTLHADFCVNCLLCKHSTDWLVLNMLTASVLLLLLTCNAAVIAIGRQTYQRLQTLHDE